MINVGLSTHKAGRLIKIFKKYQNADLNTNICGNENNPTDKEIIFLDEMASIGFVQCYVSDWDMQETSYCLTQIGKDILRIAAYGHK
jgi:hypothetical protein